MEIKVVTFNLRMDNRGDGINFFFNRAPLILNKIRAEKPDVICFQEATDRILAWLRANLYEYTVAGIGRGADFTDEANPVAFRKDRFELFRLDQFWLSPTPDVPGSRYEDQSTCPRICTVVTLRPVGEGRLIRVYNTHLDHIGESARVLGMRSVMERITRDNCRMKCPIILIGDFNATPDERCITELHAYADNPLTDVTEDIATSFHDFGRMKEDNKIDYIFTDAKVTTSAGIWDDCRDGIWLSDHYPIALSLEI